ncbi:MAG: hypothetical protein L3J44_06855 [Campylobacteraceae bacterium]|nr:hypothetical protein [Campylobacteraceae bacterium]
MIVWKGWGILGIIIPLVLSLLVAMVTDSFYGKNFYKNSQWAMPLVFVLSAIIVYLVGYKLNNKPGRIVIDPKNNERIELKTVHSMFWIPLQYWGAIIFAVGIWMYVANIGLIYKH